jgi:hypothetical protein
MSVSPDPNWSRSWSILFSLSKFHNGLSLLSNLLPVQRSLEIGNGIHGFSCFLRTKGIYLGVEESDVIVIQFYPTPLYCRRFTRE